MNQRLQAFAFGTERRDFVFALTNSGPHTAVEIGVVGVAGFIGA